jgi:Bacterial Ig domain
MSRWTWVALLAGVGVIAATVGIVYFMVPVHLYPSWFPGHGVAKVKHRTTGAAVGLVAVVAWAGAAIMAFRATKETFGARAMLHLPGGGSASDILVPRIRFQNADDEEGLVSPGRARLIVLLGVAGLTFGALGTVLGVIALQKSPSGTAAGGALAASGAVSANVAFPSDGSSVKGVQALDAVVTGSGVARVEFRLDGGSVKNSLIATGKQTKVGWTASWDSRSVPNGTYTLEGVAYHLTGSPVHSHPVTVNVAN